MTLYNFDQIHPRRPGDSLKWTLYPEDVLPLWVADMDFLSPEPVIQALRQRVEHGIFGYPAGLTGSPKELTDLRILIVERLARLYQWQVEPEAIVLVPGVVTAFNLACHAFLTPAQAVLVQTPVYPPIWHAAQSTGRLHQEMQLTQAPDGQYEIDWEAFEKAITPETGLFILCNPHNPVGRVFRRQELERLAEICLRRGVLICSDEIHCDLVYAGHTHLPIAALSPEVARRTITLMAPSKTFNLAGLQCSFAVIPDPELRKRYQRATQGLVPWVNLMGLVAAQAAYQDGQEWLDQLLVYLQGNRDYLVAAIQSGMLPGVRVSQTEGTYLAWLDCRQAELRGQNAAGQPYQEDPYQFFLDKARVALNDGKAFGTGGAGFVRLNFGCPRSILEQALQQMRQALL